VYDVTVTFPKMKVGVTTRDGQVVGIRYLPLSHQDISAKNPLAERAARQIESYRENPDTRFDLPLRVEGTPFQRAVWQAMCAIARGKTRTYGDIAKDLNGEAKAVGQACGDNRLPIVIPCHRVVAADGIGGFSHARGGFPLEAKRWLLAHEIGADAFELTP